MKSIASMQFISYFSTSLALGHALHEVQCMGIVSFFSCSYRGCNAFWDLRCSSHIPLNGVAILIISCNRHNICRVMLDLWVSSFSIFCLIFLHRCGDPFSHLCTREACSEQHQR